MTQIERASQFTPPKTTTRISPREVPLTLIVTNPSATPLA